MEQTQNPGQGREFERQSVIHDLSTSARIMDWLTWVRAKKLELLQADWDRSVVALLN